MKCICCVITNRHPSTPIAPPPLYLVTLLQARTELLYSSLGQICWVALLPAQSCRRSHCDFGQGRVGRALWVSIPSSSWWQVDSDWSNEWALPFTEPRLDLIVHWVGVWNPLGPPDKSVQRRLHLMSALRDRAAGDSLRMRGREPGFFSQILPRLSGYLSRMTFRQIPMVLT